METSALHSALRLSALLEGTAAHGPVGRRLAPPVLLGSGVQGHGAWYLQEPSSCPPPSLQVGYYSEMQKIFGDLTQQLDQPGHPDEQREKENEARLSELRALSIVADD